MPDMTKRLVLLFQHPKPVKEGEQPYIVAVTIPWLIMNGCPCTKKGEPWTFLSTEIIQ